jgi:hypothetical protein
MWMYLGPSCSNRSFFVEVGDAEVAARIQRVLIHEPNRNSGPSLIPFREGPSAPG